MGLPVIATDPTNNDVLTYTITGGTGQDSFDINPATGQITVGANASLDADGTGQPPTVEVTAKDTSLHG